MQRCLSSVKRLLFSAAFVACSRSEGMTKLSSDASRAIVAQVLNSGGGDQGNFSADWTVRADGLVRFDDNAAATFKLRPDLLQSLVEQARPLSGALSDEWVESTTPGAQSRGLVIYKARNAAGALITFRTATAGLNDAGDQLVTTTRNEPDSFALKDLLDRIAAANLTAGDLEDEAGARGSCAAACAVNADSTDCERRLAAAVCSFHADPTACAGWTRCSDLAEPASDPKPARAGTYSARAGSVGRQIDRFGTEGRYTYSLSLAFSFGPDDADGFRAIPSGAHFPVDVRVNGKAAKLHGFLGGEAATARVYDRPCAGPNAPEAGFDDCVENDGLFKFALNGPVVNAWDVRYRVGLSNQPGTAFGPWRTVRFPELGAIAHLPYRN